MAPCCRDEVQSGTEELARLVTRWSALMLWTGRPVRNNKILGHLWSDGPSNSNTPTWQQRESQSLLDPIRRTPRVCQHHLGVLELQALFSEPKLFIYTTNIL